MTWRARSGAWLAIGTAPGLLLLGAGMAVRHGGQVPVIALVAGLALLAFLLWFQGSHGLRPPFGEGGPLAQVATRMVDETTQSLLGWLMFVAMLGWFGFNVGLGGAALQQLTGMPPVLGPIALGLPIAVLSMGGMTRWNGLAVVTTLATLTLVVFAAAQLGVRTVPLTPRVDDWSKVLVDMGAVVGFGAVFAVRTPDFTAGLGRRDLAILVGLLCGSFFVVALGGIYAGAASGSMDWVGLLRDNAALGNLLLAVATVGPIFTTMYSGCLALRSVAPTVSERQAMLGVAAVGLVLGVLRFDLAVGMWLSVLGSALPPIIVPMAWEAAVRRRGGPPRRLPFWTWVPASAIAMVLTFMGSALAQLIALAVALFMTAVARRGAAAMAGDGAASPNPGTTASGVSRSGSRGGRATAAGKVGPSVPRRTGQGHRG